MKVAVLYNATFGGFGFSEKAEKLFCAAKGIEWTKYFNFENHATRTDPVMVKIVQDLGTESNNQFSAIRLKSISKQYENYYYIAEYDGYESVCIDYKKHRLDQVQTALGSETLSTEDIVRNIREILNKELKSDDELEEDV